MEDRVGIARLAMNAKVWFHTSDQYGEALQVLRTAFEQDAPHIPPVIVKIGWESVEQIREQILKQIGALGLRKMDIGQLCLGGSLAEEFKTGGACYEGLLALKAEGIVDRFVLECWPWSSDVPLAALRAGHAGRLIDGFIFYLNPLQRFVTNELWDWLLAEDLAIVAMRTVAGGSVYRMRDTPGAPEYLRLRAAQVAPIFERSGCVTWTEFCVRYSLGFSQVRSTVGSTGNSSNLGEFFNSVSHEAALDPGIQAEVVALQRTWSEEHDRHAAPWSM